MSIRYMPTCIAGDTVRFVAADCGQEVARFEVKNRELAKQLRNEWASEEPTPTFHWLGAEAL